MSYLIAYHPLPISGGVVGLHEHFLTPAQGQGVQNRIATWHYAEVLVDFISSIREAYNYINIDVDNFVALGRNN